MPIQQTAKLDVSVRIEMNYLVYLPKDYEQKESWPLLMFLHGAGERGDDTELVKKHGPPKLIEQGQELPFIVLSPQCPAESWWQHTQLTALLDHVEQSYRVDKHRIYVTGLSLGGFGSWRMAAFSSERLAAIAPICGGGETFWTQSFPQLPVWAFHGAKDPLVPLSRTQDMVDAMKEAGGNPRLTVYPDAEHDSWTETYENPALYDWFLEHSRA